MAPRFDDFHRRSIEERDACWAEQARRIDWHVLPPVSYTHLTLPTTPYV
mgnify:CR=1 FL=1